MSTSSSASDATPSPVAAHSTLPSGSALVDRAQKKRGKLPKETTDYLKDWLHRHADHPYPSEDEKRQMCNETGLTMSQVSNWMINARRRILAPLQRARSNSAAPSSSTDHIALVQPNSFGATPRHRAYTLSDPLDLFYPPSDFGLPSQIPDLVTLHHPQRPHLPHASYSSPSAVHYPDANLNIYTGYAFSDPTPPAPSMYAASAMAECELRAVNMLKSHLYWEDRVSGL